MPSMESRVQVREGFYNTEKYNALPRFISYYYQLHYILSCIPRSVLEVGIGSDQNKFFLEKYGIKVTTADIDESIKPDIVADVRTLPRGEGYDVVVAFQILEHLPFGEFPRALESLYNASKKHVIISLPNKATFIEFVLRFPFIRTIFKRDFFNPYIRIPMKFHGFHKSGQHYWEIDSGDFTLNKIRKVIEEKFIIKEEHSPVLDKYHRFFVLEKRPGKVLP